MRSKEREEKQIAQSKGYFYNMSDIETKQKKYDRMLKSKAYGSH